MMGRTHALLGLNALWLVEPLRLSDERIFAPLAIGAVVGALLPDLDIPGSLITRLSVGGAQPLMLPARWLNRRYGHRGALHSLRGWGAVAALTLPLSFLGLTQGVGLALWWGLTLGYGSHLVGDAMTRSGIPLLYPDRRRVHLLPKRLLLVTGSPAEDGVLALLALSALGLLLHHLPLGIWPLSPEGWE